MSRLGPQSCLGHQEPPWKVSVTESLFADKTHKKPYSLSPSTMLSNLNPFTSDRINRTHRTHRTIHSSHVPHNNQFILPNKPKHKDTNNVLHHLNPKLLPPLHPPRLPLRPPPSRLPQRAPHAPNLQHLLQSHAAHKPRRLEIQAPRRNLEPSRQGAGRALELPGSVSAICCGGGMFDRLCSYCWLGDDRKLTIVIGCGERRPTAGQGLEQHGSWVLGGARAVCCAVPYYQER